MALRFWKLSLAAGLCVAIGGTAQAGLLPLTASALPDGDNFRYTYGVMLTSNSTLQKGDGFVIYDFAGFIPGTNTQPEGYSFNTSSTGGLSGRTVPFDNPSLPNLIWTYNGDTPLLGQIGLGNFAALSTRPEDTTSTDFTSRTHVEDPNGNVRAEDNITPTTAPLGTQPPPPPPPPGVPEPTSLLLLAAGIPIAAGVRYVRRRGTVAAA